MGRLTVFVFLVLMHFCAALPAQEIETLFTSPVERQRLDDIRYGKKVAPKAAKPSRPLRRDRRSLSINGLVRRPDGRDTVWAEGRMISGGSATVNGVRIEPPGPESDSVPVSVSGRPVSVVRPGQVLDISNGRIREQGIGSYRQDSPSQGRCKTRKLADGQTEIRC